MLVPKIDRIRWHWAITTVALVAAWLVAASSFGEDAPLEAIPPEKLAPADANGIEAHDLGWGKQISFLVMRKYPRFAFTEGDLLQWTRKGFHQCKLPQTDWTTIIDRSSGSPIRRQFKQMLLSNGSRRILLAGEYRSTAENSLAADEPDSTNQVGTIMIYANSKELSEQITSALSAVCSQY
jgi:hypothetical protein